MLDIERVLNHHLLLPALAGLSRKAFDALLANFSNHFE